MTASTEQSPAPEASATPAAPELPPDDASPPKRPARVGSVALSLGNWFVRSRSIREAKARLDGLEPRQRELFERARSALRAADAAKEPRGPLVNGPAHAAVLELYRQSIHWTLLLREATSGGSVDTPGASEPSLAELWQRADQGALLGAAGGPETLSMLESTIVRASFVGLAELDDEKQRELVRPLENFATDLLAGVDVPQNALVRFRGQRVRRLSVVLALLVAGVVAAVIAIGRHEKTLDMAAGKPWKASSSMGGCRSPQQSCGESPLYFFHTVEENNPWVEFDLGAPTTISAVRVLNRSDCCPDRAIPFVVEIATEPGQYREVGRRTRTFISHRFDFPRQKARWVRMRALRKTWLHFVGVRILP